MTSPTGRLIARPAPSGASTESTRACAPGTRRNHRRAPRKSPIDRRHTTASGAAKALPSRRCRPARNARTAFIGAALMAGSIPSTAVTCRWPGGREREFVPVTRPAPFRSRDRDHSGAPRKARTFAPKACRGGTLTFRRRDDRASQVPGIAADASTQARAR